MLIDFNPDIVLLGENVKEKDLPKLYFIAALRALKDPTNDIRISKLAEQIFTDERFEINKADFLYIKKAVESEQANDPILRGAIKEYLQDIKFEEDSKKTVEVVK